MKRALFKIMLLVFPSFSVVFMSCTERIDIELDDTYTRLVVEGGITDQPGPQRVVLSLSGNYFENAPPRWVEGARVSISDGENTYLLVEVAPGIYETGPEVIGVPGRTYVLDIGGVVIDGQEQEFTARSTMPRVSAMDSIGLEYREDWEIWQVQLYALDPPSRDFYLFRVYVNDILMSDTIDEYVVASDEFFNGNYTYGIMVQWLDRASVSPGDTVTLEMAAITEEYANFIWELQDQTGFNTPLFSGPPANISSNVQPGAMGFFHASSLTRMKAVID
ncbi:MAG TPA: DUF4249 domain-containing protein [Bacteroidales bacterium]|nr:DUF4249 domain-containing protein [Bacteroidales bacterium]